MLIKVMYILSLFSHCVHVCQSLLLLWIWNFSNVSGLKGVAKMLSPDSPNGLNIAVITIVCGWVFVSLAILAVGIQIWDSIKIKVGIEDIVLVHAMIVSIGLVAQTTWAIVDEDMGKHEAEIPRNKFTFVARVCKYVSIGTFKHIQYTNR